MSLFPYLDQQALHERWTEDRYPVLTNNNPVWNSYAKSAVPNLETLMCPSASDLETSMGGATSYASNNGYFFPWGSFGFGTPEMPVHLANQLAADTDKTANGVFFPRITGRSGDIYSSHPFLGIGAINHADTKFRLTHAKDGLSNTLCFSENLYQRPWHYLRNQNWTTGMAPRHPIADFRMEPSDLQFNMIDVQLFSGIVWHFYDDDGFGNAKQPPPLLKINGPYSGQLDRFPQSTDSLYHVAHCKPSSRHPGGANVVMLDGSVHFIGDHISYRVFQALMTPHGKSSHVPFPEFILQDEDWK
ncbi:MAG: DUF1559 domain-containing protein [Rubripirellula sp.]